jgi:hypothetical protein
MGCFLKCPLLGHIFISGNEIIQSGLLTGKVSELLVKMLMKRNMKILTSMQLTKSRLILTLKNKTKSLETKPAEYRG